MFRFRALAVVGVIVLSGFVAIPAASAATIRTVCSTGATYTSVQAAVTAANPGDTVKLCAETFTEQVTTTKNLTFTGAGAGASVIKAPSVMVNSSCIAGVTTIVDICGGATDTMTDLTVAGPGPSGCGSITYGILVTGNASLSISASSVLDIRDNPIGGCQNGVGIRAGFVTTPSVGHLNMNGVTITGYQKNAVVVSGIGSTASIQNSTTTGAGPATFIAQNGIQISDGGLATVTNTRVSGNECNDTAGGCGANPLTNVQSVGVLLFFAAPGTVVSNNQITANDIGIYNAMDDSTYGPGTITISGNQVTSSRYEGIFEDQGTSLITGNTVTGGSQAGVAVISYAGNTQNSVATLSNNAITGTGVGVLIENQSGTTFNATAAGTNNTVAGNTRGIANTTDKLVRFPRTWWGNTTGPSNWGVGHGDTVSNDVKFFPWFRDAGKTTLSACTVTGPATGHAVISAPPGNVIVCARGGSNVVVGNNAGADLLIGGPLGGDHLIAGGGPTTMIASGAPSELSAGSGRDSLEAPAGSSCLRGSNPATQVDCNN